MAATARQIAANRLNAQHSTGPKTEDGKSRSRANALKHGLCSSSLIVEDEAAVRERADLWLGRLPDGASAFPDLVDEIALLSLRIDRARRVERAGRGVAALRAELVWDEDRIVRAAGIGEQLADRPQVVVPTLRMTPHGCDWLIERWVGLALAADRAADLPAPERWSPEQHALAFDLLMTPAEFRDGLPGDHLDPTRGPTAAGFDPAAVARRQVGRLMARREVAAELDEAERDLVGSDLADDVDARRARRYESTLTARLNRCRAELVQLVEARVNQPEAPPPVVVPIPPPPPADRGEATLPPTPMADRPAPATDSSRPEGAGTNPPVAADRPVPMIHPGTQPGPMASPTAVGLAFGPGVAVPMAPVVGPDGG